MRLPQRMRFERLSRQAPAGDPPGESLTMAEGLARKDGPAVLLALAADCFAELEGEDHAEKPDQT